MASKNSPKVFIVRGGHQYHNMMRENGFDLCYAPIDADLVLFTGGEDVTPSYYGESCHPRTFPSLTRDAYEKGLYEQCIAKMLPMVGICRGGQFLNVMNGGKMYQDVTEHTKAHMLVDLSSGEEIYVSSTHHQMMRPGKNAKLIAIANEGGIREHMLDGVITRITEPEPDVEVVFYEDTECLCFQPHPEFATVGEEDIYTPMQKYFFQLIEDLLHMKGVK